MKYWYCWFVFLCVCVCRSMSVYSTLCTHVGVWRENPWSVHDCTETAAEDEERLDAHRTQTIWTLWRRYWMILALVTDFTTYMWRKSPPWSTLNMSYWNFFNSSDLKPDSFLTRVLVRRKWLCAICKDTGEHFRCLRAACTSVAFLFNLTTQNPLPVNDKHGSTPSQCGIYGTVWQFFKKIHNQKSCVRWAPAAYPDYSSFFLPDKWEHLVYIINIIKWQFSLHPADDCCQN